MVLRAYYNLKCKIENELNERNTNVIDMYRNNAVECELRKQIKPVIGSYQSHGISHTARAQTGDANKTRRHLWLVV